MKTGVMGPQDFSGQDSYCTPVSPAGELADHPDVPAKLVSSPGEKHTKSVRVFRSDDDILHLSRSAGLKVR